MVKRYRISALVIKENAPRVAKFKGRVKIVRIGFTIKDKTDSARPANKYVCSPPSIFKPETTWETANRERALNDVFRKIVFIFYLFFDAIKSTPPCQTNWVVSWFS